MLKFQSLLYASGWSLDSFLDNLQTAGKNWGGKVIILIGLCLVFYGVYFLFKAATSDKQKGESPWTFVIKAIVCLILGGAMMVLGWRFAEMLSSGGVDTVQDLGQGGLILLKGIL